MKKNLLAIIMFLAVIYTCKAADSTITELHGMEDQNGKTHLFYRINSSWGNDFEGGNNNNIFHYNLSANIDTLFLSSGGYWSPYFTSGTGVGDFAFRRNDPAKYIYVTSACGIDCDFFLKTSDDVILKSNYFILSGIDRFAISNINDSLIFVSTSGRIIKSTDGGGNWYITDTTDYLKFISLSPFDDNKLIAVNLNCQLEESSDGGKSFTISDSSSLTSDYSSTNIYYDKDSIHIYRSSYSYLSESPCNYLAVSNNTGKPGNWLKKYSSINSLFISLDYSNSGVVYLADGNNIFKSSDYGDSFELFKTLDSVIIGIYKKSGYDKLYAATKNDIYEITSSSVKSIKHIVTSVNDKGKEIPSNFVLNQNFPNPFNPSTTISYEIPKLGLVQLKIYDVLGREITALVNEMQPAGKHSVMFNSKQTNKELSSGIYLYRLKFGNNILSSKMILLK
ncbi:MAG: T9SS type A sorting domain-containing protein [Ignavibacteriaceae bacterium]|nr:T9SS type A sorting domain-containing protein [Ignavibacteriaceae bacterium]